jgi:hydrogenase maturation protease
MIERRGKVLVLALGNDILGDDGVAFMAARRLRREFGDRVDVEESSQAGLALVEIMEGYERALLLDCIVTGRALVGNIWVFSQEDFRQVISPSPHYAGLPEVIQLAELLRLPFPDQLCILAMEVEDPLSVRQGLSPAVEGALPALVERARPILNAWLEEIESIGTTGGIR